MIISTDLPTEEERAVALEAVPWRKDVSHLAGRIYASLDGQAIDLIDASIGPNHCRAALVAMMDGTGALQQATMDLAESVLRHKVFSRVPPVDPLGLGERPGGTVSREEQQALTLHYTKLAIEDAAVRVASAGDHLANAHVRLAWEANAATFQEIKGCGFDPSEAEPKRWTSVMQLRRGIKIARKNELGVLGEFVPNDPFFMYVSNEAVERVRTFRDQIVHRERPEYQEIPRAKRTTLWTQGAFSIKFPPQGSAEPSAPLLEDRRREVGNALVETMYYAHSLWEHTKAWLPTVDVHIVTRPIGESAEKIEIKTNHQIGLHKPRFPRDNRDPGPFLRSYNRIDKR